MRAFSPLMRQPWVVLAATVAVVVLALVRLGAGGETVSGHSITSTPGVPQFHVEIDTVQDGSTFCEPVDDTSTKVWGNPYRVAVCVKDPPAAIGAFQFDLVYDDTLNAAPEVANFAPALDDNPDGNVGTTTWPNSTTGDDLGSGWDCTGFGLVYPTGDTDPVTGPGHGRAKILCLSLLGPWTLGDNETEGVLATVEFVVIGFGADILHLENVAVGDSTGGEIGSCNPAQAVPIPCFDATESNVTPTPTPAPGTPTPTPTPIPVMSHLAGTGTGGYNPEDEGQPAAGAQVNGPQGMFDTGTANTIYFADTNNHRIRKIDGDKIITTVAGNGTHSYCGDGGLATSACLNYPRDVFLDGDHNIYIADTDNNRIRKVDASTGNITTVAGGGAGCAEPCQATQQSLSSPSGVAVDEAGNIYIADTENHRIRRVDASGTITTVVGSGTGGDYAGDGGPATLARLNLPHDVYPYGSMYAGTTDLLIADTGNNRIRWVHGPSGIINTLAGNGTAGFDGDGGPAIQAQLYAPEAVAADASLAVFVADTENNRIRRFGFGEATITTFAGGGSGCVQPCPAKDAILDHPAGVAAAGSLVIANTGGATLTDVDPAIGEPVGSFGNSAACNTGVATADCVFVVLALGLILVRKQVRALLVRIRSAAGLAPGRRTTG